MMRSLLRVCAVAVLIGASVCAATEENPTQCAAKLPGDVTAEMVGLRCLSATPPNGFEGDRFQWWRPDGAPLAERPDKSTTSMSYNDAYIFVVRVSGSSDCSCIAIGPWSKDTDSTDLWLKGQRSGPVDELRRFWLRFNRDQKIADVRVGLATGAWTRVQEWPFWKDATPDWANFDGDAEVVLRCPEQEGQDVVAEVVHGFAEEATRLVIFDQDGQPHTSTRKTAGQGGGLIRHIHRFERLQRDDIKQIEFQKRPYNYWITFRNVSLRPGQKTQVEIEVEQTRTGLTGAPLPRFNVAEIDAAVEKIKGKRILLCFWDVGQRPSRNCIQQLAKERDTLQGKGVSILPVHLSTPGDNPPEEWLQKNHIPLLTETLGDNRAQARQIWGVDVLPWLILTDNRHTITAEGFTLDELDRKLSERGNAKQ